jgi:hypothetical protein
MISGGGEALPLFRWPKESGVTKPEKSSLGSGPLGYGTCGGAGLSTSVNNFFVHGLTATILPTKVFVSHCINGKKCMAKL